jgi:hypothetical protein
MNDIPGTRSISSGISGGIRRAAVTACSLRPAMAAAKARKSKLCGT